jgi:hypothetical protein
MGPDSPVRREFMEFCAANPMDSKRTTSQQKWPHFTPLPSQCVCRLPADIIPCMQHGTERSFGEYAVVSVECMPEACVLVKVRKLTCIGKDITRPHSACLQKHCVRRKALMANTRRMTAIHSVMLAGLKLSASAEKTTQARPPRSQGAETGRSVATQGKPRTRGLPAPAPAAATGLDKRESQGVGGAEEAAAEMFKPKLSQVTRCSPPGTHLCASCCKEGGLFRIPKFQAWCYYWCGRGDL